MPREGEIAYTDWGGAICLYFDCGEGEPANIAKKCACTGATLSEVSIELCVCVSFAGLYLGLPFSRPPRFQSPRRRPSSGGGFAKADFFARPRACVTPVPTGTAFGHKRRSYERRAGQAGRQRDGGQLERSKARRVAHGIESLRSDGLGVLGPWFDWFGRCGAALEPPANGA